MASCSIAQQKYKLAYLEKKEVSIWILPKITGFTDKLWREVDGYLLYTILTSFHSKKLHIFGFLARIVVISSRVIFFFNLSGCATYHFWSLNLPWRLNRSINCICEIKNEMNKASGCQDGKKLRWTIRIMDLSYWKWTLKVNNR